MCMDLLVKYVNVSRITQIEAGKVHSLSLQFTANKTKLECCLGLPTKDIYDHYKNKEYRTHGYICKQIMETCTRNVFNVHSMQHALYY